MIMSGITILYQDGTEFRIGTYRGTQFLRNFRISSETEISHIKDRISEVMRRGAMIMEPKIEIHSDYCKNLDRAEIEAVLSQITALITDAVLRAVSQFEDAA